MIKQKNRLFADPFVVLGFSLPKLAERGFRPQAHWYGIINYPEKSMNVHRANFETKKLPNWKFFVGVASYLKENKIP